MRTGRYLADHAVDAVYKVYIVDSDRIARPEEDRIRQTDIIDIDSVSAVAVCQSPATVMPEENGMQSGNTPVLKDEAAVRVAADINLVCVLQRDGLPLIIFRIVKGEDQRSEFSGIPGGIDSQHVTAFQLSYTFIIKPFKATVHIACYINRNNPSFFRKYIF
jgi:hypothetical protein